MTTLAERFDPRRNSLNFLRLVLATAVIVSHSWPLGGFGADPDIGDRAVGRWAVAGFFAISGYLITSSRQHLTFPGYLWRRVLRIYPGFFVSLLVVAFMLAPVAALVGPGRFEPGEAVGFVAHNAGLLVTQWGIGDTLGHTPVPNAWNGALWTLFYEFLCYLAVGVLASVVPRQWVATATILAFVAATASQRILTAMHLHAPGIVQNLVELTPFFLAGAALYMLAHRIPATKWLAACAAAVLGLIFITGTDGVLAAVPIAYLCLWMGMMLPLQSVGRRHDISYGMYVYGFPVQQMLALLGLASWGLAPFIGLSLVLTTPLAAASWFLVERPAKRLMHTPVDGQAVRRLSSRQSG